MPNITFILKLDQIGAPNNTARLWLDSSRDDDIEPSEEVALGTIDGKTWIADKNVSAPAAGVRFLLKFITPRGTKWSFTASSGSATLYKLEDKQTVTTEEKLSGRLA